MQVVENSAEGLKREFTITVPAADIEAKIAKKLTDLSQQVHMRGFRPGKVPVNLLRKMYGDAVRGEVLEEAVNESSQQALKDGELTPALQPKIEVQTFEEGAELTYTMAVEVMPDFEVSDLSKLTLERLTAEVEDESIDHQIEHLAEHQKTFEAISDDRKSKSGDTVVIDFLGKVDGEAFPGGEGSDFNLELGSGRFIPGFEEQLVGAKAGDEVTVNVTFPEEYHAKDVAGKDAVFDVTVKEIQEAKAVEINDEFAQQMGLEDLAALREAIKGQIEQEYASYGRMRLKRSLLDQLADSNKFDVPPGMVEMEFDQIWSEVARELKNEAEAADEEEESQPAPEGDGAAAAEEKPIEPTDEQRTEYTEIAERRVRLGLVLSKVGQENQIEVTTDEVNRAIMEQARKMPGQEQQFFQFFRDNPELANQFRAPIFEDKVVDFILEMANVTDRTVPIDELTRDPDSEDEAEKPEGDG